MDGMYILKRWEDFVDRIGEVLRYTRKWFALPHYV
jgi:hypothetical protein